MKKQLIAIAALSLLAACGSKNQEEMNPFFSDYDTPHSVPCFDKIKNEHYIPAFKKGMEMHNADIDDIIKNTDSPTFENTILAYENSGEMLSRVSSIFFNITEANTNDTLDAIAEEVTPLLSAHKDNIALNEELFKRIKTVYENREKDSLKGEELRLTEKIYKDFEREGINLPADKKEKLKEINSKLASLSLSFGNNVLKETNDFVLELSENDLDGLPESVKESMAADGKAMGKDGTYVVTMQKPSWIPFVTYSTRRDLREKVIKGYVMRGDSGNANDNKDNAAKMVNLRVEKANLLGFDTWAAYKLDINMAKTPERAYDLMYQVWTPALKKAKEELSDMQKIVDEENGGFTIQAWDWWYYAEKVRGAKFDLSEEITKPYFTLENTTKGIFTVCEKLYGLSFVEKKDMPIFHPDVKVYEVYEGDSLMGILYCDYYVRQSKRPGAWMTDYRGEKYVDGKRQIPVVSLTCNFPKPVGKTPSQLSIDDVKTYFHEFGHCLHSLLTDVKYETLAGTNVQHDFVELFSQIMERWAMHPDVLKLYAVNYKTGEVIPDDIIKKISDSDTFGQGFATTEFLAAGILDMDWHTRTAVEQYDVDAFEKQAMDKIGLISQIYPRYRTTYYNHIFSGGYSAGYYAYLWAEVLDADAFESFVKNGIFDQNTAKAFRYKMLSKGNTKDAMELFMDFKGAEPSVTPLLKSRGLL